VLCCAIALLLLGWAGIGRAQAVSESALKAAFLYNFAKFTEWPEDRLPPAAALDFCVVDAPVADALQSTVAGHSIGQHPLVVTRVKITDALRTCELLYAGTLDAKSMDQLLTAVGGANVLSVGDSVRFIETGGVVRLFSAGGQIRFAINVDAAGRAKLRLSSQLLALATIVKDGTE
jgi:hypothetical protein